MFSGTLKIEPLPARPGEFALIDPWGWVNPQYGRVNIPAGFVTDFASTPQILRAFSVFDPIREGIYAAVVHDWLYCTQTRSRAECDAILHIALLEEGMNAALAWTYWASVRVGGWHPWNARKKRGGGVERDDFDDMHSYVAYLTHRGN